MSDLIIACRLFSSLFLYFVGCMHFAIKYQLSRARGYETFFMLNSSEHEMFPVHKC